VILSEDRQTHFAHLLIDGIWNDDLVDYSDDDVAIKVAKRAIIKFVNEMDEVDQKAKGMVASLKRGVPEGSPEWDVLYAKYLEEELRKRGT